MRQLCFAILIFTIYEHEEVHIRMPHIVLCSGINFIETTRTYERCHLRPPLQ